MRALHLTLSFYEKSLAILIKKESIRIVFFSQKKGEGLLSLRRAVATVIPID